MQNRLFIRERRVMGTGRVKVANNCDSLPSALIYVFFNIAQMLIIQFRKCIYQ